MEVDAVMRRCDRKRAGRAVVCETEVTRLHFHRENTVIACKVRRWAENERFTWIRMAPGCRLRVRVPPVRCVIFVRSPGKTHTQFIVGATSDARVKRAQPRSCGRVSSPNPAKAMSTAIMWGVTGGM